MLLSSSSLIGRTLVRRGALGSISRQTGKVLSNNSVIINSTRVTNNRLTLFLRAQSTTTTNGSKNSLNKNELPFKYSTEGPSEVKYTKDHEWISLHADGTGFLGITDYASAALGDTTYVELPETDKDVEAEESIGSVESVKSASEVYMPVDGKIIEVNDELENSPQLINLDPLGKGWMVKFKSNDSTSKDQIDKLFNLEQYEEFLKTDEH